MKSCKILMMGLSLLFMPTKGICADKGESATQEKNTSNGSHAGTPILLPKEKKFIQSLLEKASKESSMVDGSDCEWIEK